MSPLMCPSKVAYAVAVSKWPGSMLETQVALGHPAAGGGVTLVQVLPPSRVSCRLPSSVPTQTTFGSFGDSAIAKIVQWFSALELSRVRPPDSSCFSLFLSLVVRSGEIRAQ